MVEAIRQETVPIIPSAALPVSRGGASFLHKLGGGLKRLFSNA